MTSLSQDVIDAKYGELEGLRRNTLSQLAKQHHIHRRNKLTVSIITIHRLDTQSTNQPSSIYLLSSISTTYLVSTS